MLKTVSGLLTLALLLTVAVVTAHAEDEKDGMVDNPMYKFWANVKPGTTVTVVEKTKLQGEDKESVPGGVDTKTITYKLANVNKERAIVTTTVLQDDFLGKVETAATKLHYPAKVTKERLDAVLQELGAKKSEDETVKVAGKEFKCKVLSGSYKKGNMVVEYKFCYSDDVPGGIVKRTRTTREGDKVVAETTIELMSIAEPKAPKKDKDKKKE